MNTNGKPTRDEARPTYLGIGFGHAAILERSATGAKVTLRGPRGVAPVVLDITVTEAGATVRVGDETLSSPSQSKPMPAVAAAWLEPRLTLHQYAALRAACVSARGDQLAEIRARYALDEPGDDAEADVWARKFSEDPCLFESYRHFFQLFRTTAAAGAATTSPSSPMTSSGAARR